MAYRPPKTPSMSEMQADSRGRSVPPKTPAPKSIQASRTVSAGRKRVTVLARTPRDLKRALEEADVYVPSPMTRPTTMRTPLGDVTNQVGSKRIDGPSPHVRQGSTSKTGSYNALLSSASRRKSVLPPQRILPVEPTTENQRELPLETPSAVVRTLADTLHQNPLQHAVPTTPRRSVMMAPARSATRNTPNAVTPRQVQMAQAKKALTPRLISPHLLRPTPKGAAFQRKRKARETPSDILRMLSRAPDLTPMTQEPVVSQPPRVDPVRNSPSVSLAAIAEHGLPISQESKSPRPVVQHEDQRRRSSLVKTDIIQVKPALTRSPIPTQQATTTAHLTQSSPADSSTRRKSKSPRPELDLHRQSIVSGRSSIGSERARDAATSNLRRSFEGRLSTGMESLQGFDDDAGFDPMDDDTFASDGLLQESLNASRAMADAEPARRVSEAMSIFGQDESPESVRRVDNSPPTTFFDVKRPSPLTRSRTKGALQRIQASKTRDSGIGLAEQILAASKVGPLTKTLGRNQGRRNGSTKTKRISMAGLAVPALPSTLLRKLYGTFWHNCQKGQPLKIRQFGQRPVKHKAPRLSREMVAALDDLVHDYVAQVSEDLGAFADHAGRKTIEMDDVVLLFRRQGLLPSEFALSKTGIGGPPLLNKRQVSKSVLNLTTLSTLARRFLPRELAEQVCRRAEKNEVQQENHSVLQAKKRGHDHVKREEDEADVSMPPPKRTRSKTRPSAPMYGSRQRKKSG